jgi:hypothetical protein
MAETCTSCGTQLSYRNSFVWDGRPVCGACLGKLDSSQKKPESVAPVSPGVPDAAAPEDRAALARKYAKSMRNGILWAVGGAVITAATYRRASSQGGTYFVTWGAIVFGIYDFFKGLFGWLKYKE